jgi:hypothetical protein
MKEALLTPPEAPLPPLMLWAAANIRFNRSMTASVCLTCEREGFGDFPVSKRAKVRLMQVVMGDGGGVEVD